MNRLVYKSVEVDPFTDVLLKRLLTASRLRNSEAGLTGMLIYDRGAFLQTLEGEASAIQSTFARIACDTRHRDISVLLLETNVKSRQFENWSMGYADGSGAAAILKGYVNLPDGLRTAALDRSNATKIMEAARCLAAA